jgi:hypothetical protein
MIAHSDGHILSGRKVGGMEGFGIDSTRSVNTFGRRWRINQRVDWRNIQQERTFGSGWGRANTEVRHLLDNLGRPAG